MKLITILLNAILGRSFDGHYARKFELEKLGALLPFEFPDNDKVVEAVRLYAANSEEFKTQYMTAIIPVGLMAKRLEYANTQSEFEGVYVCRVYFGRDDFATLHIYSDGTWKEFQEV